MQCVNVLIYYKKSVNELVTLFNERLFILVLLKGKIVGSTITPTYVNQLYLCISCF